MRVRFFFVPFLLVLISAAPAFAQAPISRLLSPMVCASLGTAEGLADIDYGSCRSFVSFSDVDTQSGVVWITGRFITQPGYPGASPLGVYTGALASREIWWNGERIGEVGRVGATPQEEIPGNLDAVTWAPPHLVRQGENAIAVRLSTHHLAVRVAAPVHYVYAARMGEGRFLLVQYGIRLGVTGALIAAALFFGVTFAMNRKAPEPLFLSLISLLVVGQLVLESLRGFADFVYPLQIWRLIGIAALAFCFGLALTAYIAHRFAPERWRLYVLGAAILALCAWPALPGFDGMTFGFVVAPLLVCIIAALRGVAGRRRGARIAAVALPSFLILALIENIAFLDGAFYIAVTLLMLVLIVDQARVLRRTREAEEAARRRAAMLELELLRRRIAPHFLMNTLNAIAEWVEADPKTGVRMIEAVADEFRLLSQVSDKALISLREEIALCRLHLDVMSLRVDRPFSLATDGVDEAAEVPPGVLHTLVENAFTHGRFANGGEFRLTCERSGAGERLVLVTPPITTHATPKSAHGGEGLAYVGRRLEAAFGEDARVESGPSAGGWRTVLTIPRGARAA